MVRNLPTTGGRLNDRDISCIVRGVKLHDSLHRFGKFCARKVDRLREMLRELREKNKAVYIDAIFVASDCDKSPTKYSARFRYNTTE